MGGFEECQPSFFKVMFGDFTKKLRVPPAFTKEYEGMLSEKSILVTNQTGKTWLVNMEKVNKNHFFGNGWIKFVSDHRLEIGDFLVFFLLGNSKFHVLLYGKTGCPKNMISAGENVEPTTIPPREMEADSEEEVKRAPFAKREHHHFVSIFKKYNQYYMCVPMAFATKTGIALKKEAIVKDPEGRAWPVIVHENGRFVLRSGWSDFVKGNKLAEGDKCLFKFVHGNVIKVDIFRNGRGRSGKCSNLAF